MFLMGSQQLPAGFSVGAELTSMLSLGLNAGHEYRTIHAEIGTHFYLLSYFDNVVTQAVLQDL